MKSEFIQDLKGQHKIADFERREYVPDRVGQIYREIAGSLLHGFAIMQDGKIVLANQVFAALAGLSISDVVGSDARQLIEFVHPDDRPLLEAQLRLQSTPDYVPSSFTARAVPEDGPDRWLEFYSNHTTFRDKPAFLTSVIDITEQRKAQQALLTSEERFRMMFEQLPVGAAMMTPDHKLSYANSALCSFTGHSKHELQSMNLSEITHPDDIEFDRYVASNLAPSELDEIEGEKRYLRKDGEVVWGRLTIRAILDAQGNTSYLLAMIEDISKRKQAIDEIRRLKDFSENIVQTMAEGIVMEDPEGIITFINPAASAMLDYTVDEIVGQHYSKFVQSDQLDLVKEANRKRQEGDGSSYELKLRTKGGDSVWALVSGIPRFDQDQYAGTMAVFTDITEHKQATEEIRRLSRALEQSPAMVIITDIDGSIVYVNPKFTELTGYEGQEIIGSDIISLLPSDYPERQLAEIRSTISEGRQWNGEVSVSKRSGELFWTQTSISPLLDDHAQISHFIILQEDITERRQTEQLRKESEQRFRSVAETAADAIVIATRDGGIEYWNRAAAEVFGYAHEDVIGQPISMLVPDHKQSAFDKAWEQLILTGACRFAGTTTDMRAVRSNGIEFPAEISHATWEGEDRRYFSVIIRDVSEARSAQRRLEAQSRLAAVGQLASGIAHDFNNILGTIILQSEMLLNGPHLSAKDRERLAVIRYQSQRAASLTAQIMDFSHRTIVALKPLDLMVLAQSMQLHLQHIIPENIDVRLVFEEGRFIASADGARLQQVFTNLTLNSRDAMPDGGEIVIGISCHTIKLGETRPFREMGPGDWIRIRVSDTGEGIKPEHLAHVFEPFFTTKPPGKGSGLGLAQVYGIIKQHRGFIDVQSREGHGTTFTIHLPAVAPIPEEVQPLADVQASGGEEETILVVEDDASTRDAIGEILRALNYEVLLASDAMEALGMLKQARGGIDLVLANMAAPKMRVADFHNQLRETGMRIPMIIMTGHPLGREDRERLILENLDWIQKPFSSDALSRKVRQALAYM